jgi:hypothetical protein
MSIVLVLLIETEKNEDEDEKEQNEYVIIYDVVFGIGGAHVSF